MELLDVQFSKRLQFKITSAKAASSSPYVPRLRSSLFVIDRILNENVSLQYCRQMTQKTLAGEVGRASVAAMSTPNINIFDSRLSLCSPCLYIADHAYVKRLGAYSVCGRFISSHGVGQLWTRFSRSLAPYIARLHVHLYVWPSLL